MFIACLNKNIEKLSKIIINKKYSNKKKSKNDNYDPNSFVWDGKSYVPKDIINAKIQDGVTEIKEFAFNRCFNLKSIKIPDSVTKIGNRAFLNVNLFNHLKFLIQ